MRPRRKGRNGQPLRGAGRRGSQTNPPTKTMQTQFQNRKEPTNHPYRPCSALKSRGGLVIHSAAQRSTWFLHPAINADAYQSGLRWACSRSQRAADAWVENIAVGHAVEWAEHAALTALFPSWRFRFTGATGQGSGLHWTASRKSGGLVESIAGTSASHLARRLRQTA
jgi:hypothetical protein